MMGIEILAMAILSFLWFAVSIVVEEQSSRNADDNAKEIVAFIIVALIVAVFYFAMVALPAYQASLNIQNS